MGKLGEPAHTSVLDRSHVVKETERIFAPSLDLLRDILNCGTHLLVRLWRTSRTLERATDRRAKQYFVAYMRKQKEWALRVTPGTPENERFTKSFGDEFNVFDKPGHKEKYAEAARSAAGADNILGADEFKEPITSSNS